ncbi:MAG TPA: polymer-forming cytoskeletal protein [Syntrophorhabdaceae bacterium]|nr:polymer-forming cytoskeletal protein [Syntrophorhabdaceae bacterium]
MFGNNEKNKLASFIGAGSYFKGDVSVKGAFRVDGELEGTIKADTLIVGEKAHIKGDIAVKNANIGGRVEGNINAENLVEIGPKGYVNGNISTGKISIAEGGIYNGKITMDNTPSKIVDFQAEQANKFN